VTLQVQGANPLVLLALVLNVDDEKYIMIKA